MAVGIVGEGLTFGASTFLVADGLARVTLNSINVAHDFNPKIAAVPDNFGALLGKGIGQALGNAEAGEMWGGLLDDAAALGATGGPLNEAIEGYENVQISKYGNAFLSGYSIYDGVSTINDDLDKIKGK